MSETPLSPETVPVNIWVGVGQAAISIALSFYVDLGTMFPILLGLIALDFVVGVMVAIQNSTLSARKSWSGVTKKVVEVLLVVMAQILEPAVAGINISEMVAAFYCFHEAVSILQNAAVAGLPVPEFFVKLLDTHYRRATDPLPPAVLPPDVEADRRGDGLPPRG